MVKFIGFSVVLKLEFINHFENLKASPLNDADIHISLHVIFRS